MMRISRSADSYRELVHVLQKGKIAVLACDTIYGFVGLAPKTENTIRSIKGRGDTKSFLILLSDRSELPKVGVTHFDDPILKLWPGPYTFVFPVEIGGTVACRVPQDKRLRALIRDVGSPLYSTSVNQAGEKPMDNPDAICAKFESEVSLIEDAGVLENRLPSTVVDLTCQPRKVLRQGAGTVSSMYL